MPELKLTVNSQTLEYKGDLLFESGEKKLVVLYSFGTKIVKSLEEGEILDLTFKINDKDYLIKGIFPEVLLTVAPVTQCIWVLAGDMILQNVFLFCDIDGGSRERSGDVPDEAIRVLFNN